MNKNQKTLLISIDSGVNTGFACLDIETQLFLELITFKTDLKKRKSGFWSSIKRIEHYRQNNNIIVFIEATYKNKPVFAKRYNKSEVKMALEIAQRVGRNKRDALLLKEYCIINNIQFIEIIPKSSKINRKQFKRITGYAKLTNEHSRDAGIKIFNITLNKLDYLKKRQEVLNAKK